MDLHIHTSLSPCSESGMTPGAIAAQASDCGLDAIAICDHNSAENVAAARKAGAEHDLYVIGGMEICSAEEVHILSLFDDDLSLFKMQEIVYDHLFGENDEKYFGEQLIVDEGDNVTGTTDRLLIGSTTLSVAEIVESIHSLGGLAIASHVDRESFSLIGQLGFIPPGLGLDAIELSPRCPEGDIAGYREHGFEIVRSSDAHYLWDVGKVSTVFRMESLALAEMALALSGAGGRAVIV